jgi:hypothetical protein
MRIRIQQLKLMRIHADPDPYPDPKSWFRPTFPKRENYQNAAKLEMYGPAEAAGKKIVTNYMIWLN